MDSSKQIAGGLTFLITAAVIVFLLIAKLAWDPMQPWPPQPDPYIALADEEFVEVVEVPEPRPVQGHDVYAPARTDTDLDNDAKTAPETGTALKNAGPKADAPAKVVTSERPSAVKTEKKPQPPKPGPTVDTKKQEEAITRQTNNDISKAFAKAGAKNNASQGKDDKAKTGSTQGNPDSAAPSNSKGKKAGAAVSGLAGGWVAPSYSKNIPSNEVGTVVFELIVNPDGSVAKATPISSSGLSDATVENCRQEVLNKKFKYDGSKPATKITPRVRFTFEDPK